MLLEARDLYCEREERVLFARVSLAVEAGDILQIEGPNGAGKTTLLRALAGLNRHVEGEILWRGLRLEQDRSAFYSEVLVIGHQTAIKLALNARENLQWTVAVRTGAAPSPDEVNRALSAVGLADHADLPCASLSAGQKRRVALARLFLEPATLWILDEPFSAIDREGVAALEGLLREHALRGGAVVVVTHHDMHLQHPGHRRLRLGLDKRGGWQWA